MSSLSRAAHAATALCAVIGLGIQTAIVLGYPADELPMRLIRMLSFFTILTNGLVALAGFGIAAGSGALHRLAERPGMRAATTVHILVVAIIFHLLLSNTVKPGMLHHWGNIFCHQIVPVLWVLCWFAFPRHGGIDRLAPLRWVIFPGLFALWTLIHGAIDGWYPYPFMNVAKFGMPIVLRNMLLIGLFFAGLGYAIRWIDGRLARWRAVDSSS